MAGERVPSFLDLTFNTNFEMEIFFRREWKKKTLHLLSALPELLHHWRTIDANNNNYNRKEILEC